MERELLSGVCGASLLSLVIFVYCALNIARPGVLLAVGAMAIALPIFAPGPRSVRAKNPALSRGLQVVFGIRYTVYLALYLANSPGSGDEPGRRLLFPGMHGLRSTVIR